MNTRCPICNGWELGDGTEDADWDPCTCDDEKLESIIKSEGEK